ncbi:MAG: hypothetical protein ACE5WD_11720 [Candidatus Aminicenantia bacterium]
MPEEIKYLEDEPFMTESCGACSHLRWGSWTKAFGGDLVEDREYGEIPCCSEGNEIWEMSEAPDAVPLTPEDALEWYVIKSESRNSVCKRYDGSIPYTKKEIEDFIKKRNEIIKKVTGFDSLSKLEEYLESS